MHDSLSVPLGPFDGCSNAERSDRAKKRHPTRVSALTPLSPFSSASQFSNNVINLHALGQHCIPNDTADISAKLIATRPVVLPLLPASAGITLGKK